MSMTQTRELIRSLERCAGGSYDSCSACEHWQKECAVTCFPLLKAALTAARKLAIYERLLSEGKLVRVRRKPDGTKGEGNENSGSV